MELGIQSGNVFAVVLEEPSQEEEDTYQLTDCNHDPNHHDNQNKLVSSQ